MAMSEAAGPYIFKKMFTMTSVNKISIGILQQERIISKSLSPLPRMKPQKKFRLIG